MSTEGQTLQVSVLPYSCSICPPYSILVVAQPSSEVPEGLMNCPVNHFNIYAQRNVKFEKKNIRYSFYILVICATFLVEL